MNAEARLALLERINSRVDVFLAYLDTDLRYVYNNAQYERWFARSLDQLTGRHVSEVVGEERWEVVSSQYERALDGEHIQMVSRFQRPDGQQGWGQIDILPDHDESNGAVIGLLVLVTNVTDLKQKEAQLAQAQERLEDRVRERTEELHHRESQLRSITDAVPAGIAFFDGQGNCEFSNQALVNWLCPEREIVGVSIDELFSGILPLRFIEGVRRGVDVTADVRMPDGQDAEVRELELHGVASQADGPEGFYVLAYDVTARQQERRRQQRTHKKLVEAQRLESLGLLTRGLAHDFSNLLHNIHGNLEMAKDEISDERVRSYLENADRATQQAAEFCAELLAYSGNTKAPRKLIDPRESAAETAKFVQSLAPDGARFVVELGDDVPFISANAAQFKQVLLNLLNNALQSAGGDPVTVRLELERRTETGNSSDGDRDFAVVRVSDNGAGMDQRARDRLFEPFFTTKAHGRGLGLAAVKGIVQAHGGHIGIESTLGKGSTFEASFPAAGHILEFGDASQAAAWSGDGLALVIDDDPEVLEVSAEVMRRLGFDVLTAASGEEGLALVEGSHTPRLVLLDLMMPGIGGRETMQLLRQRIPDLPVIIHSGFPDQAAALEGQPFTTVLPKPWRPADLRLAAAHLLDELAGDQESMDTA